MTSVSAAPRSPLSPVSPVSSSRPSVVPEQAAFVDPLTGVPEEERTLLWQGLLKALKPAIWDWEQTPPAPRHTLPSGVLERQDKRFAEVLAGWHLWKTLQLVWRAEFWRAADVLEALILEHNDATMLPLLTACCTRIGQIYRLIEQWDGQPFAQSMLEWELYLLRRYRDSRVVPSLLFAESGW